MLNLSRLNTLTFLGCLLCTSALAQTEATPTAAPAPTMSLLTQQQQAAEAAADARDLSNKARAAYPATSASMIEPLWKQAAAAAELAVSGAPNNPEYLKLKAQIYSDVGFWSGAETAWADFFKTTPIESGDANQQAAAVQQNLGYAAYNRNQSGDALAFFGKCLASNPQNLNCASWGARTSLESGNYGNAATLYQQAVALSPSNATLIYFQTLAKNLTSRNEKYAPNVLKTFDMAYADLEINNKAAALAGFQQAAQSAPTFIEAWREVGRLALDLGDANAALNAYQAASRLPSGNATDQYYLALAGDGIKYGLSAAQAFRNAYDKYLTGNKKAAETGFLQATAQNASYAKAWAWLGRTRYEQNQFASAATAYQKAVFLDPNDKSSIYFLKLARAKS